MHYYQFNIGDYASHTKGLSLIEDLAYRRMIDEYYLSEQPLNGCSTDVARCCGLLEQVEEVDYVLSRFFVNEGDFWRHKRIDIEIKAYKTARSAKSKAGKASAKARKLKASEHVLDSVDTGVEQPLKSVEQTNNHKPLTINQSKDLSDKSDVVSRLFDYWVLVFQKNKASTKLTPKRKKAIKMRLAEGYTVDQIKLAIKNCRKDPWSMGGNDRNKPFNDIELICRNGEKLESFINMGNIEHEKLSGNNGKPQYQGRLSSTERTRIARDEQRDRENARRDTL